MSSFSFLVQSNYKNNKKKFFVFKLQFKFPAVCRGRTFGRQSGDKIIGLCETNEQLQHGIFI